MILCNGLQINKYKIRNRHRPKSVAHHCDLLEADLTASIVFLSNRRCDLINFELQIMSDHYCRYGHINFWDRSDHRSGSINFLPIYDDDDDDDVQW